MTATEHVILVDENDNPVGIAEKMEAHRHNLRHRAFSVFIFRHHQQLEILLQQRASGKYHSPNLWTNTCCSHPRPEEDIIKAGERRLKEEMNIVSELTSIGRFHYIAHFENGLSENEVDHVLVGETHQREIVANPEEAQAFRWVGLGELEEELAQFPERFTPWLKPALEIVKNYFSSLSVGE